jgi:hypothetical protein
MSPFSNAGTESELFVEERRKLLVNGIFVSLAFAANVTGRAYVPSTTLSNNGRRNCYHSILIRRVSFDDQEPGVMIKVRLKWAAEKHGKLGKIPIPN